MPKVYCLELENGSLGTKCKGLGGGILRNYIKGGSPEPQT